MRKFLCSATILGGLVLGFGLAHAANLEALEAGSGQCGSQGVCLVPDSTWDITNFTQSGYDAAIDTVTGSGAFSSLAPATGSQTLYITAPDGVTVIDILSTTFTDTGDIGAGGGTVEDASVTWQAGDDGALDLGTVPVGGTSLVGDGSLQNVTPLLDGLGGFPGTIMIEAQDAPPASTPEPASLTLLGVGLVGLGLLRRRWRAQG